jgi:hypothetical protein
MPRRRRSRVGLAALCAAGLGGVAVSAGVQPVLAGGGGSMMPTFSEPALPAGMVALDDPAPPAYTPDAGMHGMASTGVSTQGGRGVAGAVLVPIVPGTAELEVGGSTGRTGVLLPPGSGKKLGIASLSTYGAALHVRPSNDVQVDIAISGGNQRMPGMTPAGLPPP